MLRRRPDDEGAALIAVVVLGFVMMVLVATGLTVATSGLRQAVGVQRSTSALDAAYAGVQDYLARLNLDKTYIKYGNPSDTFNTGTKLKAPDPWNPAFGMGAPIGDPAADKYATWATVPGSDKDSSSDVPAKYRYEVNVGNYTTTGVVQLRVTGLSGSRTRTIIASLRVKGFVDYGYFTDFEIKDPETFVVPSGAKGFDPNSCVVYAWSGKRPAACSYVNTDDPSKTTDMRVPFKSTDLLYGDAHTNDTPTFKTSQVSACGMVVTGQFETGAPTSAQVFKDAASCTPKIPLVSKATLAMPATNTAMQADAKCVYTGPTQITYLANGFMDVISPWTKLPGKGGTALDADCGTPAALASPTGAHVKQLDQDLLYVQNVKTPAEDPNNGWASTSKPSSVTCIGADGSLDPTAYTGIGWSFGSGANRIRYPLEGESPATSWANTSTPTLWNTTTPAYGCRSGDLYVSGKVTTLTTAASQNYVWITHDITYGDRTADLLGLVGQSSVVVWNPMSASADQPMVKPGDVGIQVNFEIDAAIVSVAHTFRVQNHDRGSSRGSLEVFGSIAQKFRGSVAAAHVTSSPDPADPSQLVYTTTPTGYTKAYQYDTLLKTVSPPKFLEPSATSFTIIRYATVPIAFSPNGTKVVAP